MGNKRKWVIIGVLAAVMILAAGLIGGAAYAATSTPTTTATSPGKSLADRVATILGIDQSKVEAAFTQAEKDMQTEALDNQLKSLVSAGKITQAQADQYKTWIQSRPSLPAGAGLDGGNGMPGGGPHGMGMPGPMGGQMPSPTATATK
jgi:hypothetical protein